jgi:hypothetical protein
MTCDPFFCFFGKREECYSILGKTFHSHPKLSFLHQKPSLRTLSVTGGAPPIGPGWALWRKLAAVHLKKGSELWISLETLHLALPVDSQSSTDPLRKISEGSLLRSTCPMSLKGYISSLECSCFFHRIW